MGHNSSSEKKSKVSSRHRSKAPPSHQPQANDNYDHTGYQHTTANAQYQGQDCGDDYSDLVVEQGSASQPSFGYAGDTAIQQDDIPEESTMTSDRVQTYLEYQESEYRRQQSEQGHKEKRKDRKKEARKAIGAVDAAFKKTSGKSKHGSERSGRSGRA